MGFCLSEEKEEEEEVPGNNYRIIFIDASHAQQFRAMWSPSF